MTKPLHTGDVIRLINPGCNEPSGDCVVIADQSGGLVWFIAYTGGAAFVVRRSAVKVIQRRNLAEESHL